MGEAAASAAEHASPGGPGSFRCSLAHDAGVRVEVRDRGRRRPVPADYGHHGHGPRVMGCLTRDLVVEGGDDGTRVRFRLPPGPVAAEPPAVRRGSRPAGTGVEIGRGVRADGRARLVLRGDLDLTGREPVLAALRGAGPDAEVDPTGLRYLSSAGVAQLAEAGPGLSVVVAEGSAPARVLALTGPGVAVPVRVVDPRA